LQKPNLAAGLGNFHITHANERESWVTVAEERPEQITHGDTLLGRIHWAQPNQLGVFHRGI